MVVVRILERKEVIRLFGLALFLSPIFNTMASMSMQTRSIKEGSWPLFWKILSTGSFADHALFISGFGIGLLMLGGSSKNWRWVLFLMGGHLFRQVLELGSNLRTHWIYGLFFLINITIFLFILDQLVWKQKSKARALKPETSPQEPPALAPAPEPHPKPVSNPAPAQKARKKVWIHFEGVGPWAQLLSVTSRGFFVRSMAPPPPELAQREVELQLKNGLILKARLSTRSENEYFFEYSQISAGEIKLLNQWLQNQAA